MLKEEELRKLADGRVYTARQAKDLGLVDQIGYLDDAIELAKDLAGLKSARLVTYVRPGAYKANIYSKLSPQGPTTLNLINVDIRSILSGGTPKFMYLWSP